MGRDPVFAARLADVTDAWRELVTGLIAVAPHLSHPYPDDERWTPWSRFVEGEIERMDDAVGALAQSENNAHEALRVLLDALETLESWQDDFGSRSITTALWAARDRAVALLATPLRDENSHGGPDA